MVFQFEREAEQGAPMPDGLSLPDQCAYKFLSSLYRDIRTGAITKEQAIQEKGKMTYQHSIAVTQLRHWDEMGQFWAQKYKDIEKFANRYAKDRTLENADMLYQVIFGLSTRKSI